MTHVAEDEFAGLLYHAAPVTRYKDTAAARAEGTSAVETLLRASCGRFLAVADWNSHRVQQQLARTLHAEVYGHAIDAAVAAGMDVLDVRYVKRVGGVTLGTDHPHGALRLVVRRPGRPLARRRVVWFYNVRVGRAAWTVDRELRAMLTARRTFAVFLVEAGGYLLPRVRTHELVRDRSTGSRANLAAYVRRGHLRYAEWVDLQATWKRTEHDGMHDPRSLLVLLIGWSRS